MIGRSSLLWSMFLLLTLIGGCELILPFDENKLNSSSGTTTSQGGGGTSTQGGGGTGTTTTTATPCLDPVKDCSGDPGDCKIWKCDEDMKCAVEGLDGVPEPGTTSGDCGGVDCVKGEPTNHFADVGAPCSGMTPKGNPATLCDGAGQCVACNTADDCNPAGAPPSFCFTASCMDKEKCIVDQKMDGVTLPANQQIDKDCKLKVCQAAQVVDVPQDTDLPDDGNKCTSDTCAGPQPTFLPTPKDTPCGVNGDLFCNGTGVCANCTMNGQCGNDTDCHKYVCNANNCMDVYPLSGTAVPMQTSGDCLVTVCDGAGGTKPQADDADLPDDANDCTLNLCSGGSKSFPAVGAGAACLTNRVCDGIGNCLGGACQNVLECPPGAFCVDGLCCNTACNATCQACSVALKNNGLNGDCGTSASGTDYMELDCPGPKVCNGTAGANACKLPNGQMCVVGADCLTGNCIDGYCCNSVCGATCQACNLLGSQGTCTNIPNAQDPANECPGTINCNGGGACGNLLGDGLSCSLSTECQLGNCIDGLCCNAACGGLCQACNLSGKLGMCSSIPAEQDPAMECAGAAVCNGAGACKTQLAGSCAQPSDCASGICIDGLCCNSACGGLCQACNTAGNPGVCSPVPAGQDPVSECPGVTNCNGSGACSLLTNGTACMLNGECQNLNCVDGVCCNNSCTGTCKACNVAGNIGTCTNIPSGQDPLPECAGARVCNGMGACAGGPNGAACGANGGNTECASMFCTDGVCCGNACSGVCQACNLIGTIGTCSSIANGTDPAMECPGVTSCNGANACALLANGAACVQSGECSNGNCIDGVCCGAMLCATCQTCNGGSPGTCTNIAQGAQDNNPANACAGTMACNGSGNCKKAAGQACSNNGDCASGTCLGNNTCQ